MPSAGTDTVTKLPSSTCWCVSVHGVSWCLFLFRVGDFTGPDELPDAITGADTVAKLSFSTLLVCVFSWLYLMLLPFFFFSGGGLHGP